MKRAAPIRSAKLQFNKNDRPMKLKIQEKNKI